MRALLFPLLCLPLACGPVGATSLIADADIAASRAHASDGLKVAPYEAVSADLYLQKAKEEAGRARYGSAMELAQLAKGFAEAATLKSSQQRTDFVPVAPAGPTSHPALQVQVQTAAAPLPTREIVAPPAGSRPVIVPTLPGAPATTPGTGTAPAPREKKPFDPETP